MGRNRRIEGWAAISDCGLVTITCMSFNPFAGEVQLALPCLGPEGIPAGAGTRESALSRGDSHTYIHHVQQRNRGAGALGGM